jgi:hypothetical protein
MRVALTVSLLALSCGSTPFGTPTPDAGGVPAQDGGTPAVDGGPTSCAADPDCGPGRVCESGACQDACSQQNPCPGGFAATCVQGHCRQRCLSDATCPAGQICEQFVCGPAQCDATHPCNGTNVRCAAGRCETFTPCTTNANCPPDFTCQSGVCEELPRCLGDGNCAAGEICEQSHCREAPACSAETDCTAEQDCVAGLCVPHVCRGDAECPEGQICTAGRCEPPGDAARVFRVVILSPGGVLRPGETRALTALALDQRDRAVEGIGFEWSTSDASVVGVDAATGVVRGGDQEGGADITARALQTPVVSDPVRLTTRLAAPDGTLVITLVDRATGALVQGAKVLLGGQVHDVNGSLSVPAPDGAVDFTVFHAAYDYVTVVGTGARDIVLPLTPRSVLDPAAGLTGEIDLRQVSTQGPVRIGLAGVSSARPFTDFDLGRLLGDLFYSQVSIPGQGTVTVPLPGGMTLSAEVVAGVSFAVKGTYYVLGDPGLRAAWSLGGRVDLQEVTSVFQQGGGGGSLSPGAILRQVLPLFQRFDHGAAPAVALEARARVVDSRDVDGDGDRAEKVPDWGGFRRLTLVPRVRQSLRTEVVLAELPLLGGSPAQGAILTAGVLVPGTGFVPLGLGGVFDDDGDGKLDPVILRSAPVHSGLGVGRYGLVALALSLGQGAALPQALSARTATWEAMPTRVEMGGFLPFVEGASYEAVARRLRVPPVAGARFVRAVFQSDAGAWELYAPAGEGELTAVLPAPPAGVTDDLAAGPSAHVEAVSVAGEGTLDDLVGSAAMGLAELNRLMDGFSRAPVARQ